MKNFLSQFGLILIPISLSILLTAILILLLGGNPLNVYATLWEGAFRNEGTVASVINFWLPLSFAGLGLVVTFRAGLWNIGIEGQIMMGAVFASWGAQFLSLPSSLLIPACLMLAALGGTLWGLLVGVLKTRLGVHEIFGGVALNATANNIAIYLIAGPWQPPEGGSAQSTNPFPETSWLAVYSADFAVPILMIVILVLAMLLLYGLLYFTRWGLELKAVGKNPRSALLLGVKTERVSLMAFAVCGALGGLAGAHRVLHTYHALRPLVSGGIGFLALLLVLLVGFRLIFIPFVAFVAAALMTGSVRLQTMQRMDESLVGDSSLVGVLQGIMVLLILFFNGFRERWFRKDES
jgi:ABC-type uncharacterized transport system permease subunit